MKSIGGQGEGKLVFVLNNLILSNNFECVFTSSKLDSLLQLCFIFFPPSDLTLKLITPIQLVLDWGLNAEV